MADDVAEAEGVNRADRLSRVRGLMLGLALGDAIATDILEYAVACAARPGW